ncbi:AsmA-like C-terminal region-containing protein [Candidatus Pelagibacter communis]|uniref:AsmA-like C-terminal region-containing protein n=1 Tax=Pelagibacter ubique TaxID=198252 RepID=UPI00065B3804|nr:AsmA-like C-terminal region-containing protein [Candidatus Pelagibacter ubique]
MKINIFKYFLLLLGFLISLIFYLSIVGIETDKFNQQIKDTVVQSNNNLDVSLKKVKLILDPLKLKINAKTIGAKIYYANRPLELEYIKTQVSLDSILKTKLVSSNFEVATKSILLKDFVKFIRATSNKPELLILETFIKKGHIILDLNLNLDQNGKIKNDYKIRGLLKDGKFKFFNGPDFNNIDFLFNIEKDKYLFEDIKFASDQINFSSKLLKVKKKNNNHYVEGKIQNSEAVLSDNLINILNLNLNNFSLKNTKFSSENIFNFEITNKYKLTNLKLDSDINFKKVIYNNNLIPNYFSNQNSEILLDNHKLKLIYENKALIANGAGEFKLDNKTNKIEYTFKRDQNKIEFETNLNIKKGTLKNQKTIQEYFPLTKDQINIENHKINLKYKNKDFTLKGEGKVKLNKDFDYIKYFYNKNDKDFEFISDINLKNVDLKNQEFLKQFFPSSKKFLNLQNHKLNIKYKNDSLTLSGNGNIKIGKNYDEINYFVLNDKEKTNFDLKLILNQTDFEIKNLNYKKNINEKTNLVVSGILKKSKNLNFESISILDKRNKIKINNLILDKDYLIDRFDKIDFDYIDTENKDNQFIIQRQKQNDYKLNGLFLNANSIVTNLLESKKENENKIFKNNFKLNLNLNEVYIDEINFVKNLQGLIFIKDNEVVDANLSANFENNKNIVFSIETKNNGEKITKLYSSKAKPLVKRYKFIKGFDEGDLDFISIKKNEKSVSNLKIYDFKLKEVPALTKLLTLASLQGIADILTGEGIRFEEFEMNFSNEKSSIVIDELYAIGPAISILMSGYIDGDNLVSLRGTLVPATTINKTISKIPLLGKILVGEKTGEGVFGVSFKIKGPPKDLETSVNPIKTLTPRFITRTLDKIKRN